MKDLFNHIEKLPIEMQEICNRFNLEISENGCTCENVNEFLKDCINCYHATFNCTIVLKGYAHE